MTTVRHVIKPLRLLMLVISVSGLMSCKTGDVADAPVNVQPVAAEQAKAPPAPVSFASLLQEMVNRDALASFPNYTSHQTSSYSKASWYDNHDFDQYIRSENVGGRTELVMLDTDGPGALTRMWIAGVTGYGTLRFYIDNSATPTITAVQHDFMNGNSFVKAPFVFSGGPLTLGAGLEGGVNMMLPIPYRSHLKVTYDGINLSNYYNLEYRTYSSNTPVTSFALSDYANQTVLLASVGSQLTANAFPPSTTLAFADANAAALLNQTLSPGSHATVSLPNGALALRFLQLKMGNATEANLQNLSIQIKFDNEQTVDAPVGGFFGSGEGLNPGSNQMNSIAADGTLATRWTMPYQSSASITLTNTGPSAISFVLSGSVSPWAWNSDSMHFHATYLSTPPFTGTNQDISFLQAKGSGVYVGDVFTINNSGNGWWGEGDEKIFVDGDYFPSHFGTGTEDYFTYGWCQKDLFQSAWSGELRVGSPGTNSFQGVTSLNRIRMLDGIPFKEQIRFDMEHWNWEVNSTVRVAHVALWYAKPGAVVYTSFVPGETYTLQSLGGPNLQIVGASTADGAQVEEHSATGATNQQFKLEDAGGGYYSFTNVNSSKVLEIPNGATADLVQLQQRTWDGSYPQMWSIQPIRNGYYRIVSRTSGKTIDVFNASTADGTPIEQYPFNGTDAQLWKLNRVSPLAAH